MKTNNSQIGSWCKLCTISIKKKYLGACAFVCAGISFFPVKGLKVFPLPPSIDALRVLTVSVVFEKNEDLLVKFKEIDEPSQMELYDKTHLLVDVNDILSLKENVYESDFSGWNFFDETSNLAGKIISVQEMPSQLLVECEIDGKSFSFPLIDDFVLSKNNTVKDLRLRLPMNYFL